MEFYNLIGIRRVAPLLLVLLAAISSCHSGPAVAGTRQRHEYSDYTPFAQQLPYNDVSDSSVISAPGGEIFEYYGGARGKLLVLSPDGKATIMGHFTPPGKPIRDDSEDEEDVGVAEDPDSVAIEQPPASASVAEAKPIAVSIAGQGGTASAQPVATAVVGAGGLALTRPVATAVAGIKGAEALAAIAAGGPQHKQKSKFDLRQSVPMYLVPALQPFY